MNRSVLFWIIAFVITLAAGVYQRMTGPTYPVKGSVVLQGNTLSYLLERSHDGEGDHPVRVETAGGGVTGVLEWKRHNTADAWTRNVMTRDASALVGDLPHQPPAGKVDYRMILSSGSETVVIPEQGGVVLRFKGHVPVGIIIVHVIVIFAAMMFSTRTGLEFFNPASRPAMMCWWTVGLLAVGGMILGPVVQKYAFDAYWTGWPFGHDLTDNKTLVALLAWVVAALAIRRSAHPQRWVLGAAVVVFVVFLIPHSVLGSELDYTTLDQQGHPAASSPVH